MSDHDDDASDINNDNTQPQQQQNIQPQIITTVSNNNEKFPYLKNDEYEVWAMKMEYWIINNDMNIWKVIQNGNNLKRTRRDRDGRVIILPPTTADEHIAVQRESKARTTLLQSIPDDHVADFHYMDDARDIWNAVKARFGGNVKSKKMRKSMLKQEFSEINAIAETAEKELQTKLDNHLVQTEKERTSSKNLFRLIDSSMSVRTKVGLGFNNYIRENELGWDDSAFSVFTTISEEVKSRPLYNRFAKTDSMKAVHPPLSGDYTSLSDHIDLDKSQMSYVKSSEPKSNDSTSCASTSSVSTSESEAEIESKCGRHLSIQESLMFR
ncbi:hypothetical protein Tco_0821082 [Tanacetum coccineum]|uniref:Xylulose kinase-1 n=1 Tax=Tanacetum coccineum TaxID=301880 RepID=A0ABQ5AFG5_9ASTR